MSFFSLLSPWRHTRHWLAYEKELMELLASTAADVAFTQTLRSQIDGLFEVRRERDGDEYTAWPAFNRIRYFATREFVDIARIEATVRGEPVVARVGIGGGMIANVSIRGRGLPKPPRIELEGATVVQFDLPKLPDLPEATGWVRDLVDAGVLERGRTPLSETAIATYVGRLAESLPADYVELSRLSNGGLVLPDSVSFGIYALNDLSVEPLLDGRTFIPLVDMREDGGLAVVPGTPGIVHIDGDLVRAYAPSFREALERLARDYATR